MSVRAAADIPADSSHEQCGHVSYVPGAAVTGDLVSTGSSDRDVTNRTPGGAAGTDAATVGTPRHADPVVEEAPAAVQAGWRGADMGMVRDSDELPVELLARAGLARLEQRQTLPRAARPPSDWDPPATGARYWPEQLPDEPRACPAERGAVEAYTRIVRTLDADWRRGRTVRGLAADAGISPSMVQAVFRGQRWPSPVTVGRVAAVLELRVLLTDPRQTQLRPVRGARTDPPPDRRAREQQVRATHRVDAGEPMSAAAAGALARTWHDLMIEELFWRMDAARITQVEAARRAGVARSTLGRARTTTADDRRPLPLPVIFALAHVTGVQVSVKTLAGTWPLAPWEQPPR
jgi:transcriptional regulator with XRE-family HTH domain